MIFVEEKKDKLAEIKSGLEEDDAWYFHLFGFMYKSFYCSFLLN